MKFVDLAAQFRRLETEIRESIDAVLAHGQFIMGPEVYALEEELAEYCGAEHVISAASGTDALLMSLMSYRIGPGDAVVAPPFTFVATAEVIQLLGATTIFVDVDESTFNLDANRLEETVRHVRRQGRLNIRGIVPVDLFGLPADYAAINEVAASHDLFVLADAAQSFGGARDGRRVGTFGDLAATSFFPSKPLGCYGDGGAVFTGDGERAEVLRSIRFHGKGASQYDNIRTGITGRLDTLQAAVLRCKLKVLDDEIAARRNVAERYTSGLSDLLVTPTVPGNCSTSWAQYTVRSPERDRIRKALEAAGIPSAVYYACPLHRQPAFRNAEGAGASMPVSDLLAGEVLSLPMHPYLEPADQDRIIDTIRRAV